MKDKILLLILIALVSIASSVATSRVISQPAHPSKVFVKQYFTRTEAVDDIKELSAQGWEFKQFSEFTLVMVKY